MCSVRESKYVEGFVVIVFERRDYNYVIMWRCGDFEAHINSISQALDDLYRSLRMEFIDELLGTGEAVIIHVYREPYVVFIEDYNRNVLTIRIPSEDLVRFFDRVRFYDRFVKVGWDC